MAFWVVVGLLVTPVAEIAAFVVLAGWIGGGYTALLLLAFSLAGGWLLRREGTKAWRAFREAVAANRAPTQEMVNGVAVLTGGLLMLLPGFLTGLVGLVVLLPPGRGLLGRIVIRRMAAKLPPGLVGPIKVRSRRARTPDQPATAGSSQALPDQASIIEGTVVDDDRR
jgi:UPF0716 protein FxsA